MILLFPMSGESSRFYKEGYNCPKYELPLGGQQLFDHVLEPFLRHRSFFKFVFVVKDAKAADFLADKMKKSPIKDFKIININQDTKGQAATARIGLSNQPSEASLGVFNIDTIVKQYEPINFSAQSYSKFSGVLEVFEDCGDNWSYIKVNGEDVTEAREKEKISNLASNGMYYFKSVELYLNAYDRYYAKRDSANHEHYIAPMYNQLIEDGHRVTYRKVAKDNHLFCGTPSEYDLCIRNLGRYE